MVEFRGEKIVECFKSNPSPLNVVVHACTAGEKILFGLMGNGERIFCGKLDNTFSHPSELFCSELVWYKYLEDDSGLHCCDSEEFYENCN